MERTAKSAPKTEAPDTTRTEREAYRLGVYHGLRLAAQVAEGIQPSAASTVSEADMRSYRDAIVHAVRVRADSEWEADGKWAAEPETAQPCWRQKVWKNLAMGRAADGEPAP